MSTIFIGKWTFNQASNTVQIDPTSGILSVGAPQPGGNANFNAYGDETNFVLQGANGLYVVSTGTGYAATKTASDPLNRFALAPDGTDGVRVIDLGVDGKGPTQSYWNTSGNTLSSLPKSGSPPATTLFVRTEITPGLATILAQGFDSPQPDLIWVNLAGTDFTAATAILDFTQSQLSHADLSKTKFSPQTAFDGSLASFASFAGAVMNDCSIGGASCTNSDFTNAKLAGIQADRADFSSATLTGASFKSATNLAHAKFVGAKLQEVDFSNTLNIVDTDFTGADLTGAVFTGSSVTGTMTVAGANLTDAALDNSSGTIYPGYLKVDSKTNFTRAKLQHIDFSGYALDAMIFTGANLTGCSFHGATMRGTELSYATLDRAAFTGTVLLNGANLSNASMQGADLTNAQLGALSSLFSVASGTADYNLLLNGLKTDNAADVQKVFANHGYTLSGTVTITQSYFSATTWTVQATAPSPQTYTVLQQTIGGTPTLVVYTPVTPAVLSNAFMVNVKLTGANLIGINASGASIYGVGGSKPSLNTALLQDAQFSNANLSNADFSSADLGGVNFDYAILTNAVFQNAQLITSGSGTRSSLIGTNLQAANFDGATLSNVTFTNAAVSVANPASSLLPAGVWLFAVPPESQPLIAPELEAAAAGQFTLTNQALQQLQTPGPVGPGIVKSFQSQGIELTDAVLSIMGAGLYWQLTDGQTHYVIFESYDPKSYAPALGVAPGSTYTTTATFYLPLSLRPDLKNGPVDAAVIEAFKNAGHPISASATILVAQHPTDWQIINGAPDYDVYSLWLGVISNAGLTITVRPAIPNLIAAFNAASIGLSTRATVTALSTKNGWSVSNNAQDPYNPVINYITFNMIQTGSSGSLDAYGGVMRVARVQSSGQLEYYNIAPGITALAQSQLAAPGNVCPNGDFATTNQANGLPYPEWLRARVAPRPPRCIPDPNGMFNCPK